MPDEPLTHVRRPDLPWRASRLSECGRPLTEAAKHISRDEALALVRKYGKQRAAFLLCMACITTASNSRNSDDLAGALAREFTTTRDPHLEDELRAIQMLVSAHRDEFDGYLEGLRLTTSLDAHRRNRRRPAGGRP